MDSISMSVYNKNAVHDDTNQRLQARRRMSPAIQTTETVASYTKGTMSSPSSTPSSSVSTSHKGKTAAQQRRFPFHHFRIHPCHDSPPHSCHHRSRRRRRGFRGGGVGVYINGRSPQTQTHHHHYHHRHRRRYNKEKSPLLSFSSSSSSLAAGEVVLVAASTTTATRRPPAPSTSTSTSSSSSATTRASASTLFTSPCSKLVRAFEKVLWTPSLISHHSHPVQPKQTKKASTISTSPVLSPKKQPQPPQKQNKKNAKLISTKKMPSSSSSSSLKSLTKMNIDAQQLIQAATLYAKDMRRMGLLQSARDMETNLVKAQALLKAAPEHVHRDLEALLAYEQSTHQFHRPGGLIYDPSGAVGFLWMRRSLAYQYHMFHLLLHPEESSSSPKTKTHPAQAALEAYQSELQPYHGWALQKISQFRRGESLTAQRPRAVCASGLLAQVGGTSTTTQPPKPSSQPQSSSSSRHHGRRRRRRASAGRDAARSPATLECLEALVGAMEGDLPDA